MRNTNPLIQLNGHIIEHAIRYYVKRIILSKMNKDKKESYSIMFRFHLWIYKIKSKRVLKCVTNNYLLSWKILVDEYKEKYKNRSIHDINQLAHFVIEEFFYKKPPKPTSEFYQNNKNIIKSEVEEASNNELIKNKYCLHLQLMKYYFSKGIIPKDHPNKADLLDPSIRLLSKKEYKNMCRIISKEWRMAKKDVSEQIKLKREKEMLERIPRVEIASPKISTIITLFSVLFLCTGFFYNYLFLGYFGVDPSKFFNIYDYLASSVDKIFYSFVSVFISCIIVIFLCPEYIYGEFPEPPRSKWGRIMFGFGFLIL